LRLQVGIDLRAGSRITQPALSVAVGAENLIHCVSCVGKPVTLAMFCLQQAEDNFPLVESYDLSQNQTLAADLPRQVHDVLHIKLIDDVRLRQLAGDGGKEGIVVLLPLVAYQRSFTQKAGKFWRASQLR